MADIADHMHNGETGSVTVTAPMPDQIPSNPGTIRATTAIESLLQLITANWIYKTTLTVDPSMQAGHVFGYLRIHPDDCNVYVAHVAQMFKAWTGGMEVRARFMANFANGGSFRVGFLPPTYTEAEVAAGLPVSTLTAYPNIDLDPKNTDWIHFRGDDERNVLFHWLTHTPTKPEDFGGWLIFYVVGPLVSTMQAQGSVSMVLEVAGRFDFVQPAPLTSGPAPTTGPLLASTYGLQGQALCDTDSTTMKPALLVLPKATNNLQAGFLTAFALGGADPTTLPGNTASEVYTSVRTSLFAGNKNLNSTCAQSKTGTTDALTPTFVQSVNPGNLLAGYNNLMAGDGGSLIQDVVKQVVVYNGASDKSISYVPTNTTIIERALPAATVCPTKLDAAPSLPVPSDLAKVDKMPPNESIIIFGDLGSGRYAMQTRTMADEFKALTRPDPNQSFIYNVKQRGASGVLLQMRLCSNGMWTTTGSETLSSLPMLFNEQYTLEFVTAIPYTTPLPGAKSNYKTLLRLFRAEQMVKDGCPAALAYKAIM